MTKKSFNAENTAAAQLFSAGKAQAEAAAAKTAAKPTAKAAPKAKQPKPQNAEEEPIFIQRARQDGEKRDARICLAIKPSLALKARNAAWKRGTTLAHFIETLIEEL